MWVCKCTELCLWSGDIFRLWSAERLGWAAACSAWIKMQCVDHCWVPVWRPAFTGLTHHGCEGGRVRRVFGGLYLHGCYPSSTWQTRGYPRAVFHGWMLIPAINLLLGMELREFLIGPLPFCIIYYTINHMCTSTPKKAVYQKCLVRKMATQTIWIRIVFQKSAALKHHSDSCWTPKMLLILSKTSLSS